MVRPMANSPPKRVRNGSPERRAGRRPARSASSTIAAPTSRAWSRTGSSRTFEFLGDGLRAVEHALDLLGSPGDVGVEGQRPVDLDHVDGDQLALRQACQFGDEADDPRVARATVEGDERAPERGCVRV